MAEPGPQTPPTLPIAEAFASIQGEGSLVGVPSFFIRVSGCNLRCSWCDTPYASWNPDGRSRPVSDLIDEADRTRLRHAVLTGGEPMIFPAIVPLAAALRERGFHVTIETAGTIDRPADCPVAAVPCDLMSLSPKLANSTPVGDPRDPTGVWAARHESRRLNFAAVQRLIDTSPSHQFKFVVRSPADLPEVDAILSRLTGWSPGGVFLMPEGVTPITPDRAEWIVKACLTRGWRFGPRLHLDLFGNRRGT